MQALWLDDRTVAGSASGLKHGWHVAGHSHSRQKAGTFACFLGVASASCNFSCRSKLGDRRSDKRVFCRSGELSKVSEKVRTVSVVALRVLLAFLGILGLVPNDLWCSSYHMGELSTSVDLRRKTGRAHVRYLVALLGLVLIEEGFSDPAGPVGGGPVFVLAFINLLSLVPHEFWRRLPKKGARWRWAGAERLRYLLVLLGPVLVVEGLFGFLSELVSCIYGEQIGNPFGLYSDGGLLIVGAIMIFNAFIWTPIPHAKLGIGRCIEASDTEVCDHMEGAGGLVAPIYRKEVAALERVWKL